MVDMIGPSANYGLTTLLDAYKQNTMMATNCVMIGTIEDYNSAINVAKVSINFKKQFVDGTELSYPLLEECPVFVLGGGDGFVSCPVKKGDTCLVLFNDRNIDTWYLSGQVKAPQDGRCHNIADGIALVGIRSVIDPMPTPSQSVCVNGGSNKVSIKNSTTDLKTLINKLIDLVASISGSNSGGAVVFTPSWGLGLTGITGIKSEFNTLLDEGTL